MTSYGSIGEDDDLKDVSNSGFETVPLIDVTKEVNPAGLESSPWRSRLFFAWFSPLLVRGNEKQKLDPEDLDLLPLPAEYSSSYITSVFDKYWREEVTMATARELEQQAGMKRSWITAPSLLRALYRAFGWEFVGAGLLKFCHDACLFVGPQVLNGLIYFLRDANAPLSRGLWLTLAVTISQLVMSFCLRHYFFKCYITGLQIRTSIVLSVYKKALVLASGERQRYSTGEITNLLSIDAQRMQNLTTYLHAIWYSFFQIGLALYFLWKQLGSSCLGGVAVIIVMMPATKAVAQWMGTLQKSLMTARDDRVDVNSEVMGSMKVIKMQAWEESFQDRINALRDVELRRLLNYMLGNCISVMLWSVTPLGVALATFAAYIWSGHELDVASALTALALFDILRFPLFMFPQVINNLVEASVSFGRVRSFLLCDDHEPVSSGDLTAPGIRIRNATFVYESKKPKVDRMHADPKAEELVDIEWKLTLLRAQLDDAENHIEELEKAGDENSPPPAQDAVEPDVETTNSNLLCLKRINFSIGDTDFIAVVGGVASGKSSVVNAILGEVRRLSGTESVDGSIAYFAQTPFILNATVRDNILFGHVEEPFDEQKYQRALSSCALEHDLKMLPAGDMTEIGEKGITMSGGQKARLAMARVVYHDAAISILDDPLAAVDAHVGKHIFQKCIIDELLLCRGSAKSVTEGSPMKKRTVILITNALQYLSNPMVDRIVVLRDGRIVEEGNFAELSTADSVFSRYLAVLSETGGAPGNEADSTRGLSLSSIGSTSFSSLTELGDATEQPDVARVLSPKRRSLVPEAPSAVESPFSPKKGDTSAPPSSDNPASLMTDELLERETGNVDKRVYLAWAQAAGGMWVPVAILVGYGAVEGINVVSKWWLTYWSEHGSPERQTSFLAVYALINLATVLASFLRLLLVMMCGLRASRHIFASLLVAVLHAPVSFFDTTPIGRIINRFSKDMYTIDEQLVATLRSYLTTLFTVLSTIIVISGITPVFTLCLVPIIMFYGMQQRYFTMTYRELKRLDSITRSPLYALLGETLDGVSTIRAYSAQDCFASRMTAFLDKQQHAYFLTCTAQCWLAIRLELVGTLIITFACLSTVLEHASMGGNERFAGLAGLAISYALSATQSLNWSVRMGSDFEANMVAVERVEQYTKIRSEAPRNTDADKMIGPLWPSEGEIDLVDVKLRYRPGLPLVLKGLDLHIPGGSKVGVVGRTGAGKSTLMLALLRIVELDSGHIRIDGVDIRSLGLSKLRSNIAVIPQDPVLFSGSVRTNLDPFDDYKDEKLYEALSRVGLYSAVRGSTSSDSLSWRANNCVQSLTDPVTEGGSNFSVGQRQLLVIARALICGANVVIMDEATSSVDADTDSRIQRAMRTEFAKATTITVAHRLNTIMDSDFILVMDDGRAAEFGPPSVLLERSGMFSDLVAAAAREDDDIE